MAELRAVDAAGVELGDDVAGAAGGAEGVRVGRRHVVHADVAEEERRMVGTDGGTADEEQERLPTLATRVTAAAEEDEHSAAGTREEDGDVYA